MEISGITRDIYSPLGCIAKLAKACQVELTAYSFNPNSQVQTENFVPGVEDIQAEFQFSIGEKGKGIGQFEDATDVTYVQDGKAIVTDMINSRLVLLGRNYKPCMTYELDEILEPVSTAIAENGNFLVTSRKRNGIFVLSRECDILDIFGQDELRGPSGITVTKDNRYVVTDIISKSVLLYDANGKFMNYIGNPNSFVCPRYVTVNNYGDIIVSDAGDNCIKTFTHNGDFLTSFGKCKALNFPMRCPYGIVVDQEDNIIVADHYNNRLSLFNRKGEFIGHLLTLKSGIMRPQGLALTPDSHLYVTVGSMKATVVVVFKLFKISDSLFGKQEINNIETSF